MSIDAKMLGRTVVLVIALLNSVLTMCGRNPLEISDDTVYTLVSAVFMIGAALWNWWKNNSITPAAKRADDYMKTLKQQGKGTKNG